MGKYNFLLIITFVLCCSTQWFEDACKNKECTGVGWDTNMKTDDQNKISQKCGKYSILGGYKKAGNNIWFQKKFKLPEHKSVTVLITAYYIDSWNDDAVFMVTADGNQIVREQYNHAEVKEKQICGTTQQDKRISFRSTWSHTSEYLQLTVTTNLKPWYDDKYFGFNNVSVIACEKEEGDCGLVIEQRIDSCRKYKCKTNGWSTNVKKKITSKCGKDELLGGYRIGSGHVYFKKKYSHLKPHTRITLKINVYALDSWDDESFTLSVDTEVKINKTFKQQDFKDKICANDYFKDNIEELSTSFHHTSKTLTIQIQTLLNEDTYNESFGFNNIEFLTCFKNYGNCYDGFKPDKYIDKVRQPRICLLKIGRPQFVNEACKCFECVKNGSGFFSLSRCVKSLTKTSNVCAQDTFCYSTYEGCENLLIDQPGPNPFLSPMPLPMPYPSPMPLPMPYPSPTIPMPYPSPMPLPMPYPSPMPLPMPLPMPYPSPFPLPYPRPNFIEQGCIGIYSKCNYQGQFKQVCEDIPNLTIHPHNFSQISSIYMPSDFIKLQPRQDVSIHEDENFTGDNEQVQQSIECLPGIHISIQFPNKGRYRFSDSLRYIKR